MKAREFVPTPDISAGTQWEGGATLLIGRINGGIFINKTMLAQLDGVDVLSYIYFP